MTFKEHYRFSLNRPAPTLDSDIITLAHGSGGLLTNRLLDNGVFELFDHSELQKREDGAVLNLSGSVAFSTDSFVISPIFFPGGNIGELAVNGTVNDVAMTGGIPQFLSLAFIIEEGLPVADFWEILLSIEHAANQAGVKIVTGDTKVVERGKGDQIFINTTGVGRLHQRALLDSTRIKPGDSIIVSGNVASHGMAILSKREGLEFETDILSDTQALNDLTVKLLDEFGHDIKVFRDPTRGGMATVLNEIAGQVDLGVALESEELPILPAVKSACEIFGLDPLYVANEGLFIAIVSKKVATKMLDILRGTEKGKDASIIGSVVEDHPGKVTASSGLGGKRVVSMPIAEQLPRIC
ncbi:MAG TPA: hydrogenase expression/formation protein HypE [Flavobacteriales bacterium]|jgi:hydrogenase expression/formation protein HypE|nr:hydrogenase expression/formation protein HypE [Flavobacteriales bacterium]